ncbi:MAG: hypothetical protein WBM98_04320 [Maribacter sp.]
MAYYVGIVLQFKGKEMDNSEKLFVIKLVHTLIWLFFVLVIFYILYSGITDHINSFTWIAIGLVILEGIVLLLFKMFCPLTLVARKYSTSKKDNFDIFLPNWLARYNKKIFTTIYLISVLIVLVRVLFD